LILRCAILVSLLAAAPLAAQTEDLAAQSRRAGQAMAAGKFDEAERLYRGLIAAVPDNPGLILNLGLALYSQGRCGEARPQFEAALRKEPKLAAGWLLLGICGLRLGEPEAARGALAKAVELEPGNVLARLNLGEACLAVDDFGEAAGHFRAAAQAEPANPAAWRGLGLSYVGVSNAAAEALREAYPDSDYWDLLAARSLAAQNQDRAAFARLKRALENPPPGARGIHAELARIYERAGKPEWAAVERRREEALPPLACAGHPVACAWQQGRHEEVLRATTGPGTAEALYWRALAASELAQRAYSEIARLPPSTAAHSLQAEIHSLSGRHAEAAAEWQRAVVLEPQDRHLKRKLADSLWRARDWDRLEGAASELTAREPQSAEAHFLLGEAQLNQGQLEAAIRSLEQAIRLDARLLSAHASLGRAYLARGEAAAAVPHLERASAADRDGQILYQLAQAYQRAGDQARAREALVRYRALSQAERRAGEEEAGITPP
jgi:predicted Zn-dependent protease